jgi:hypothetical protein
MNITQKQRISVEEIGVLPVFNIFASVLCVPVGAAYSVFLFSVIGFSKCLLCFSFRPRNSYFILWLFYPRSNEENFLFCIDFSYPDIAGQI